MARKEEDGIKYFPMNTDIIHNPKIKLVVAEFGPRAWTVLLPLYCKIYREKGYWLDWCNEDLKLLFAQDECRLDVPFVDEVVAGCIRRGLFDKTVFDVFGVLTSDRIQENYLEAKSRSKNVFFIQEFKAKNLSADNFKENVNIIELNVNILSKKVNISTQKEKENKRRIKEKGENIPPDGESDSSLIPKYEVEKGNDLKYVHAYIRVYKPPGHQPYVDLWNIFAEKNQKSKVRKLSENWKKKLHLRLKDPDFDLPKILNKAKDSDFLMRGSWFSFSWLIKNDDHYLKVLQGEYDNEKRQTNATSTAKQGPTAAEQKGEAIIASVIGGNVNADIREGPSSGA